ncbi:g1768 [Coccomyxa elongata]
MSSDVPRTRENSITKTSAKEGFCLSDKDLESLVAVQKPNPRSPRSGPPMSLYLQTEIEALALQKWGGQEGLDKERQRRLVKRLERAQAKAVSSASQQTASEEVAVEAGLPTAAGVVEQRGDPDASSSAQQLAGEHQGPTQLPQFITERVRDVRSSNAGDFSALAGSSSNGRHVLYWMRTAVRGHENPALDVARAAAERLGVPLYIAALLLRSHTHPTARRYTFWMQGLRDTQLELRQQGLELLVHLDSVSGPQMDGWAVLKALATTAFLVITEEMPVSPYAQWTQDLAAALPQEVGFWAVDTACLYPMRLIACAPAKAYIFRSSTDKPRRERLNRMPYTNGATDWTRLLGGAAVVTEGLEELREDPPRRGPVPEGLDWEPLDLTAPGSDIAGLLARCDWIDREVPAIAHMRGGSGEGYARWEAFRCKGLDLYAAHRNNALKRDGVSRLSAYHHYGMISPFKVARDALFSRSNGATKYVDEFFTWREVAHAFCFRSWPTLESTQALPQWAQQTLARHSGDAREVKTMQQLEQGTTGDHIWDAMQHQLNTTGELHNNLRMKWGKAFLPWQATPDEAIAACCHVNHRYALDGCDPCSYGGILWCFGLFDKPMGAESTPIFGSLRRMPTASIARRLDWAAYRALPVAPFAAAAARLGGVAAAGAGAGAAGGGSQPSIESFFKPRKKARVTPLRQASGGAAARSPQK